MRGIFFGGKLAKISPKSNTTQSHVWHFYQNGNFIISEKCTVIPEFKFKHQGYLLSSASSLNFKPRKNIPVLADTTQWKQECVEDAQNISAVTKVDTVLKRINTYNRSKC